MIPHLEIYIDITVEQCAYAIDNAEAINRTKLEKERIKDVDENGSSGPKFVSTLGK